MLVIDENPVVHHRCAQRKSRILRCSHNDVSVYTAGHLSFTEMDAHHCDSNAMPLLLCMRHKLGPEVIAFT